MDMKQLLEKIARFAGEPEQKPGEQWKGTDKAPPGKKLVGDSILRDLSKGLTPKTAEQKLAEEWAAFNEEDLGVNPKRPGRKNARPNRGHKEQPRYKTVKTDESYMSEKDIELQDYRSMSHKEFQTAHGISKTEWINKNKAVVLKNPDIKRALGVEELKEATRDEEWQGWVIRYETAPKVKGQPVNWMAYSKKRGPGDAHKGTANSPKEAVESAKAWILSGGNAKEIITNKPLTIDFNVKFSSDIVNGNKFYANIVKGPTLIISNDPGAGLKPSSVRNRKNVETNETTPLAVIGMSGAEARAAGLVAHGRYKLGDTQQNQDGSISYPLIYQSTVQAKGDTMRLPYPALTVAMEREVSGLEEGWNTGSDRVSLSDEPSTYWAGKGALQKEYEALYDQLVPAQGAADTIEGEVLRAASKIVYRHYNDGDEFNKASFDQLKAYIGTVTSYDELAHKATEFALNANGNYRPNAGWDSLDVMDYGPAGYEDEDEDDEDNPGYGWDTDDEEDVYESVGETFDNGDAVTLKPEYADADPNEIFTVSQVDNERQRCWISSWHGGRGWYVTFDQIALVDEDEWDEPPEGAEDDGDWVNDQSLWEGAADRVYTINIVRERMMGPSSSRSTSGTLPELLDYFGYTLEVGKSYERERGRYKINMQPKNIDSLVDNLNKAQSNAAANGHSSTYYEVADEQVTESDKEVFKSTYQKFNDKVKTQKEKEQPKEGRGDSKGLHKKVKIVKGRDAGKTGYVRQIKTDKLRNRVYLDLDLEDGGQAVVLKQDVRLVKDLAESYTGRETKDGVWRVFKDGQAVAAAGPFKSAEEANSWIKKQNQGVAEGMEEFAKSQAAKRAAARKEKSQPKEGWESGPEEYKEPYDDADDAYDRRRQEKLDAEAEAEQAKRPQTKVYSLSGRGPNMEPNYKFPGEYDNLDAAVAARKELMADPKTPHPEHIGISSRTKYLDEIDHSQDGYEPWGSQDLKPGEKALKGKPVKAKDAGSLAKDAFTKAFGGDAKELTKNLSIRKGVSEGNTPLRNKDDYDAKRKALQDLQLDPDTHKDPQLKAEVVNRLATLNKEYAELSTKMRGFKESRGHKVIATKLANMDRMKTVQIPTPAERQEQIRIAKEKEAGKKQVKEYGADQPTGTAGQTSLAGGMNDPKQAQAVKQATQALKTATGSTAPTASIAKALDTASQGKPAMGQEAKALEPLMKDMATVAQEPKLAGQFKSLINQINQTQLKQQK